jgi:hypothetical protein
MTDFVLLPRCSCATSKYAAAPVSVNKKASYSPPVLTPHDDQSVMLTPENVDFKGHMVEEFEELQPILFQNGLLRRMGYVGCPWIPSRAILIKTDFSSLPVNQNYL